MGKFLAGLIVGLIVIPVGVYMYFSTGSAPVATSSAPKPFERVLAGLALDSRLSKEMPKPSPIPADEAAFVAARRSTKTIAPSATACPAKRRPRSPWECFPSRPSSWRAKASPTTLHKKPTGKLPAEFA